MNDISVMFRVAKSLRWGLFLAGSMAVFAQNSVVTNGGEFLAASGGEFSILGSLPGDQVYPSISLSPSAGVIAWQANVVDKHGGGIGGALLNGSFGSGRVFRATKTIIANQLYPQLYPKVQLLADGNTVFVWQCNVAGAPGIYARLAKGTSTQGIEDYGSNFYTIDTRLNTYLKGQVIDPAVAALPDGGAIVTWSSYGQNGSMWGIFARELSAKGAASPKKEFQVSQYTQFSQRKSSVAALTNGNFVIAWVSEQERFSGSVDVYARIFNAAGAPVTDEIPVNSSTNWCDTPDVAPNNDGGFTVVWAQKDLAVPTNSWDIWGRAFSASGSPEVADFRINAYLYGDQYGPKIAASPAGSLVVWTSMAQDGSREGVFGRFLQAGSALGGGEMQVNTTTISSQKHPAVAWNGAGNFLVVWTSFVGTSGFDLYGQTYTLTTSP